MGKRSTSRRLAIQILYQMELSATSLADACEAAFSNTQYIDDTLSYAEEFAKKVWQNLAVIDPIIDKQATGWKIERLNIIDKSILRLGVYELLIAKELAPSIVIDEALELAKAYSDPESAKFVNGILGGLVADGENAN